MELHRYSFRVSYLILDPKKISPVVISRRRFVAIAVRVVVRINGFYECEIADTALA